MASVSCAENIHNAGILDQIQSQYGAAFDHVRNNWSDTPELRAAIGKAAKTGSGWFKRQDKAQKWFEVLKDLIDRTDLAEKDFFTKVKLLRTWVDRV